MRRLLLGAFLLACLPLAGAAQSNTVTFETVTFTNVATSLSATTIRPAGGPVMTTCSGVLETAPIRIRLDGTAPTATVGTPITVGSVVTISGLANLDNFKGIRTGAASGVIAFHCSR